ncbi:MAG: hypothetical protein RXO36_05935 [Candidatus Nanopusillus acidilobi]
MENVKWITKKDESGENKHIPIRPRKPFGVSREKALRDVEKLREMGLRARLIETNRKHKLYAPYKATIDEEENSITENESKTQKNETREETKIKKENEVKTEEKTLENRDYAIGVLRALGFLKPLEDKLNITQNEINQFFTPTKDGKIHNLIEINDDYIKYLSTDESGTITIKKITPNDMHLENGKYELYYDESDNSLKFKKIKPDDTRPLPKEFSYTDYGINGITLRLDEGTYKDIIDELNKLKLKGKTYYLDIQKKENYYDNANIIVREKIGDYLLDVDAIPINLEKRYPDDKYKYAYIGSIDANSFKSALTMVNGTEYSGPIFLDIMNDRPLIIRKIIANKEGYTNEYAYVNPIKRR